MGSMIAFGTFEVLFLFGSAGFIERGINRKQGGFYFYESCTLSRFTLLAFYGESPPVMQKS